MTIHKLLYHPITLLFVTILSLTFYLSLDKSAKKTQVSGDNIKVLEHEINQVSGEIIELEEKIADTESLQFKEKVVRNELLLKKQEEYVLQIPTIEEVSKENDCQNCNLEIKQKPITAWKNLLF